MEHADILYAAFSDAYRMEEISFNDDERTAGWDDEAENIPGLFYSFPCSHVPTVNFTFGGVDYPILKSDLIYKKLSKSIEPCTGSFVGFKPISNFYPDHNSEFESFALTWTVGMPFLLNVYSVFDVAEQRIRFTSLTSWSDAQKPFKISF